MNESLITIRYVKALYELAVENKNLEEVSGDIQSLLGIIHESKEFNDFIENPIVKNSEKISLLNQLFGKDLQKISLQLLNLLVENNRIHFLKDICFHFLNYYKQNQGIKAAVLTTAISLSKKHRDEIYNFISRKFKVNIELTEKVNPSIIGGFVLRIEDQQINASIKAKLNKIKRELIHT